MAAGLARMEGKSTSPKPAVMPQANPVNNLHSAAAGGKTNLHSKLDSRVLTFLFLVLIGVLACKNLSVLEKRIDGLVLWWWKPVDRQSKKCRENDLQSE